MITSTLKNWYVTIFYSQNLKSLYRNGLQLLEAARGLEYIHSRNIVHGNLHSVGNLYP
jgi:hypothetical protein